MSNIRVVDLIVDYLPSLLLSYYVRDWILAHVPSSNLPCETILSRVLGINVFRVSQHLREDKRHVTDTFHVGQWQCTTFAGYPGQRTMTNFACLFNVKIASMVSHSLLWSVFHVL